MKIIQLGNNLINLDKIVYLDLDRQILHMTDKHEIMLTNDDIQAFVFNYNQVDTDEMRKLLTQLARLMKVNPDLLSREGLIEGITIMVRYNSLTKELKELTKDKKLNELSITKLVEIYKEIKTISEEFEERIGF